MVRVKVATAQPFSCRKPRITQNTSRDWNGDRLSLPLSLMKGHDILRADTILSLKGKRLPYIHISTCISSWLHLQRHAPFWLSLSSLQSHSLQGPHLRICTHSPCTALPYSPMYPFTDYWIFSSRQLFRAGFLHLGTMDILGQIMLLLLGETVLYVLERLEMSLASTH